MPRGAPSKCQLVGTGITAAWWWQSTATLDFWRMFLLLVHQNISQLHYTRNRRLCPTGVKASFSEETLISVCQRSYLPKNQNWLRLQQRIESKWLWKACRIWMQCSALLTKRKLGEKQNCLWASMRASSKRGELQALTTLYHQASAYWEEALRLGSPSKGSSKIIDQFKKV